MLNFHGVDGFDVYNCSIPFLFQGKEYMFGRIERRSEWARSWVGLFQKIDQQNYQKVGDTLYMLEDPCVQKIGDEFIMEGTHVKKRANEKIESFFAYFHRGTDIHDLHYFATGPDNMKDVRLVPLQDGRIGVFPGRGEKRCLKSTETKR